MQWFEALLGWLLVVVALVVLLVLFMHAVSG